MKLLIKFIKPPTAMETWINIFPFLENQDWGSIYKTLFDVSNKTYLQSFQYNILNRILMVEDYKGVSDNFGKMTFLSYS